MFQNQNDFALLVEKYGQIHMNDQTRGYHSQPRIRYSQSDIESFFMAVLLKRLRRQMIPPNRNTFHTLSKFFVFCYEFFRVGQNWNGHSCKKAITKSLHNHLNYHYQLFYVLMTWEYLRWITSTLRVYGDNWFTFFSFEVYTYAFI